MRYNFTLCFCAMLFSFILQAQETTTTFKITGAKAEGLAYATVTVVSVPDSSTRQEKLTDSSGSVSFVLLQGKPYRVQASAVEYALGERALTIRGDNPVYTIVLKPN